MATITFQAIIQGDEAFVPDASGALSYKLNEDRTYARDAGGNLVPFMTLADIDPAEVTEYSFTNRPKTLGLNRRAIDRIATFDLERDEMGKFLVPAAAELAQIAAFMETYCEKFTATQGAEPPVVVDAVTRDVVDGLPEGIVRAYYRRSNPGVSLDSLKKRKSETPPTDSLTPTALPEASAATE